MRAEHGAEHVEEGAVGDGGVLLVAMALQHLDAGLRLLQEGADQPRSPPRRPGGPACPLRHAPAADARRAPQAARAGRSSRVRGRGCRSWPRSSHRTRACRCHDHSAHRGAVQTRRTEWGRCASCARAWPARRADAADVRAARSAPRGGRRRHPAGHRTAPAPAGGTMLTHRLVSQQSAQRRQRPSDARPLSRRLHGIRRSRRYRRPHGGARSCIAPRGRRGERYPNCSQTWVPSPRIEPL